MPVFLNCAVTMVLSSQNLLHPTEAVAQKERACRWCHVHAELQMLPGPARHFVKWSLVSVLSAGP